MSDDYQSTKIKVRDRRTGGLVELDVHLREYKAAADCGLSLTQYLNIKHQDVVDIEKDGGVLSQAMLHGGIYTGYDSVLGARPPKMSDIMNGSVKLAGIVRPDGTSTGVGARLLYPEIVMQLTEATLRENYDDFLGTWNSMMAQTASVAGAMFTQPIINLSGPSSTRSNMISQLAEPSSVVSITTSDVSRRIPTRSIMALFSDQALEATTLDLMDIIMSAQARKERISLVHEDINAIVEGDPDRGETAKPVTAASVYDSAASASQLTQKAFVKYLYKLRLTGQASITHMMMDLNTAILLSERSGKPVAANAFVRDSEGFSSTFSVDNVEGAPPKILVVPDGVVAAGKMVGIDQRTALRRVIDVTAAYQAVEAFVTRRATAFRIDTGEITHTLYADAFNVMTAA